MLKYRNKLKEVENHLINSGLGFRDINDILSGIEEEIDQAIIDLIENGLKEVVQASVYSDAYEILKELTVKPSGYVFEITTISGIQDLSAPPIHMLPHLLNNAKISKEGNLYKTIPVKQPSNNSKNLDDYYRKIDTSIGMAKTGGIKSLETFLRSQASLMRNEKEIESNVDIKFKTASSKQDPNKDWVIPAKNKDMTYVFDHVNAKIERDAEFAINKIVEKYSRIYG